MIGLTIGERIDIAVAVASGLVALATGVLAWKTWSVADATGTVAKAAPSGSRGRCRSVRAGDDASRRNEGASCYQRGGPSAFGSTEAHEGSAADI